MKKNLIVAEVANVVVVDQVAEIVAIANADKVLKNTLSDEQAGELIIKEFDSVSSKNAMLKHLRALGYSIAMSRVFKLYTAYESTLKIETSPIASEESKALQVA